MGGRVVLHSDLNNCYASIECMLHPELRGKFIAVCGSTEDRHGIVLAKNQLAKQCGVKTGEVIWEARQKCPQLTIVPPHMDQYLKFSRIVRAIYLRYSPEVESFGIDESWIELTGSPLLAHKTPAEIANEIRKAVKEEVGLTVCPIAKLLFSKKLLEREFSPHYIRYYSRRTLMYECLHV
jgi:DNA polymerase-4